MNVAPEEAEPLFVDTDQNAPLPDLPFIHRDAVIALVRNPASGAYLCLKWKRVDWETFVTGGIEQGQGAEEAARTEIRQETGYVSLRLVAELPRWHSQFHHWEKGVNRFAHFQSFLFELTNGERLAVSEDETARHESLWLSVDELKSFRLPEGHRFVLDHVLRLGL